MFATESFLPFTQALYAQFNATHGNSNFFISPLSIYSALSLVLPGAESECRVEMIKALRLNMQQEFSALNKNLGESLQSITEGDDKKTLVQANGIFINRGFTIQQQYSRIITDFHKAITHELNFSGYSEDARVSINKWISDNTKEKIKDLLQPGTITALTRLVLANAVYFKGSWLFKFDKNATNHDAIFHTLSNTDVKTSMMYRKGNYPMADFVDLEVRCLKIPFECHEMLIVLPEKQEGLPDVLEKLKENPKSFIELFTSDQYFSEEVVLKLPKFTLGGESMELKKPLDGIGLKSIFSSKDADFSGITGDRSLFVSDVYHQAVIEVDEDGAEAAAASAIPMMMRCMPMPPPEFCVDHPFLFFIVTKSGFPVFMGHVVEPKQKKA